MQKILSYIKTQHISRYYSEINGDIFLNLRNGQLRVDSAHGNVSYGALQKILAFGLKKITFPDKNINVLVLGTGGGSVIQTLRKKHLTTGPVIAVDIDPVMLQIAKDIFRIDTLYNASLICADAKTFLTQCTQYFQLIITDVFIDDTIPLECFSAEFWQAMIDHLTPGGHFLFNSLYQNFQSHKRHDIYRMLSSKAVILKEYVMPDYDNHILIGTMA
jgi:spermidine synthase